MYYGFIIMVLGIAVFAAGVTLIYLGAKRNNDLYKVIGIILTFVGPGLLIIGLLYYFLIDASMCYAPAWQTTSPIFALTIVGLRRELAMKHEGKVPKHVLEKILAKKGKSF